MSFYHFNFLKDIKVHGFYYNNLTRYLSIYPFIKREHSHDFYSVLVFSRGEDFIRLNNDLYSVGPKTICLIGPGQMHSFGKMNDVEGIILLFCQDFYVEEFSFVRLLNVFSYTSQIDRDCYNPCITLSDEEFNSIIPIIESIQREYESYAPSSNADIIIRSLLNIILLKINVLYELKSGKSNKSNSILIHTLSQLLDTYYIQEQQTGFYSSAFNISQKQLNDICKQYFNCGLKKILQNRLMQEARKLLLSSELSVSEIAYKLNFEDNSYFIKVFKNNTGITPKRFREIHKKLLP